MSRYVQDIILNKPDGFVNFIMEDYLNKFGFRKGGGKKSETVYRAGNQVIERYRFLKWSYAEGILHLEAWTGGLFGTEIDMKGYFGTARNTPYEESLKELFSVLKQELPAETAINQVISVTPPDNISDVWTSLACSGIGLVTGFSIGGIGIVFSIIGFYKAKNGLKSSMPQIAHAGMVANICVIGLYILRILATILAVISGM